eukprot:2609947-Pyramimonas_sp.AAC.1
MPPAVAAPSVAMATGSSKATGSSAWACCCSSKASWPSKVPCLSSQSSSCSSEACWSSRARCF